MFSAVLVTLVIVSFLFSGSDAYNQKPIYHLTPEDGHWINDPNGPFYDPKFKKYHIFAQYNPNAPYWGDMSWIHWVSDDLIKWETLPVAIENDQPYDIYGAFSGSAIIADDKAQIPYLVYTCVDEAQTQRQCYATAKDSNDPNYVSWTKASQNPIIDLTSLPPGSNNQGFRDPTLWPHSEGNNVWSLAVAAQLNDIGHIVRYDCKVSTNDQTFSCQYYSSLWNASTDSTASFNTYMVECPDFYDLSDKYHHTVTVLKYSIMEENRELYEIGDYDEVAGVFNRNIDKYGKRLEYDYGPNFNFYASKRFYDSINNRQILWGWSNERDDQSVNRNWAGAMALPRQVIYDDTYKILRFPPIKEIEQLRGEEIKIDPALLTSSSTHDVASGMTMIKLDLDYLSPGSLAMEVDVVFTVLYSLNTTTDPLEVGVLGRQSSDGKSYVKHAVGVRRPPAKDQSILYTIIDTTQAGGTTPSQVYERDIPSYDEAHDYYFSIDEDGTKRMSIDIKLFYDHSIIEMYAMNGAHASTVRVYPDESNNMITIYMKSLADSVTSLKSVKAWNMNGLWK
eukprot:gene8789-9523_t